MSALPESEIKRMLAEAATSAEVLAKKLCRLEEDFRGGSGERVAYEFRRYSTNWALATKEINTLSEEMERWFSTRSSYAPGEQHDVPNKTTHTEEEIRKYRRFVYKSLVDTNPSYVEQCLRKRKRGLADSLRFFDTTLSEEEAKQAADEMMWWAPKD